MRSVRVTTRETGTVRATTRRPHYSLAIISVTVQLRVQVFWVISVYFNVRNILPKSGTLAPPPGHPVQIKFLLAHCLGCRLWLSHCVTLCKAQCLYTRAVQEQAGLNFVYGLLRWKLYSFCGGMPSKTCFSQDCTCRRKSAGDCFLSATTNTATARVSTLLWVSRRERLHREM